MCTFEAFSLGLVVVISNHWLLKTDFLELRYLGELQWLFGFFLVPYISLVYFSKAFFRKRT